MTKNAVIRRLGVLSILSNYRGFKNDRFFPDWKFEIEFCISTIINLNRMNIDLAASRIRHRPIHDRARPWADSIKFAPKIYKRRWSEHHVLRDVSLITILCSID